MSAPRLSVCRFVHLSVHMFVLFNIQPKGFYCSFILVPFPRYYKYIDFIVSTSWIQFQSRALIFCLSILSLVKMPCVTIKLKGLNRQLLRTTFYLGCVRKILMHISPWCLSHLFRFTFYTRSQNEAATPYVIYKRTAKFVLWFLENNDKYLFENYIWISQMTLML